MLKQTVTLAFLLLLYSCQEKSDRGQPNVILIMLDDVGYGDIQAHGNPHLKTPHLDRLHGESVRFTNFHVDPSCSPSRAAILTGQYSSRSGVWHTIGGRSLLQKDKFTMGDIFRDSGYEAGRNRLKSLV